MRDEGPARRIVPLLAGATLVVALTTVVTFLSGTDEAAHRDVAPPVPGAVRVRAVHSGLCLDERPAADGGGVRQAPCAAAEAPRYALEPLPGGFWQIVAGHPENGGRCLGVDAREDGAPLVGAACGPRALREAFRIESLGRPVRGHLIRVADSGLCVTVRDASRDSGAPVVQQPCARDGTGQLFGFDR
ncbi:RICIN domain-containing protein [Streptomyces coeruleoprunus]|uniref:RICIN domain-containing protein n=1 Tax=Streptomyces coeruleoprunus TaxID=285563 RepID=A0ABV9XEY6_9ACTN